MSLLHFAVLLPFAFAILVPFAYRYAPKVHTGWFVLAVPLALLVCLANFMPLDASSPIVHTVSWIPTLGVNFTVHMDGLALLFALIITGVGLLVVLYSIYYMYMDREAMHNFYVYLLMFMGAMLGVVLSDNILVLYLFWEMTSVSSFLLIAYWYQRKRSREGALKAMLITVSGGFAMFLGFILLYVMAGTFSIRELIASVGSISDHGLFIPAMLLILLGAFTKSAQFPFHIWLPDAMEAPTPISAYLHSATMVKAGVYLVARFTPLFGEQSLWFWLVVIFGVVTLFWGSFMAIRQTDLKAMLAYSTISQLGLIMSLLGVSSAALNPEYAAHASLLAGAGLAAIFHLVNHSIFKGSLFMVVGILDHETGTRDIRKLGGLMAVMPASFTLALIGGLSMAGLPPFGGFLSKEMFFTGMLSAARAIDPWLSIIVVVAWLASVLTFVYCLILVFKAFTGPYHPERLGKEPHEAPIGMLVPPAVLAVLALLIFFFPNVLSVHLLEPAMHSLFPAMHPGGAFDVHIKAWHGFSLELFMTIGLIALGALLYLFLRHWSDIYYSLPRKLTLNSLYDNGLTGMERLSARLTGTYMTGSAQHYLAYIFTFIVLLVGGSLLLQGAFSFNPSANAPIHLYEYALGICTIIVAVFTVFSNSRLTLIMAVGALGYLVSLYFVIFRAPDLALTQLVVETITTALFMLCFYFFPKISKELTRIRFRLTNLIISLGVGVTLTLIGLSSMADAPFEPISDFFKNSYELAGANNMVNALLVDFRAFDTLLEGVVLFTAGIGVFILIKLRYAGRDER